MAKPEYLKILQQGVAAWNQWRDQYKDSLLDLPSGDDLVRAYFGRPNLSSPADIRRAYFGSGLDLRGAHLPEADLSRAKLSEADLTGANLTGANLSEAQLYFANLTGANLYKTDLSFANLIGINFSRADLRQADFTGANLCGANLSGADISMAHLGQTVFQGTNLTAVRGLVTCRHMTPSIIDHRTLIRSGRLPLAFLRGCGLPDRLIEYLPSLLNEPIQYDSLFISYASRDHAFAERLYADLQNKGVRCWYAPEDLKIGDEFRSRIDAAIHVHERLLLILSVHSIKSQWVQKEVETAFEKEAKENRLVLFPIRLDDAAMQIDAGWAADIRRQRHIGNFTQWKEHDTYQQAFTRLLRDLKAAQQPDVSP